jgi:hypothetical protein
MNKMHGLNTDTVVEGEESETSRIIDELHTKVMAILDQGKLARLERKWFFDECYPVVKFLDSWTTCHDADDLVACAGINASTLFVCPVKPYEITAVTREEMEREIQPIQETQVPV